MRMLISFFPFVSDSREPQSPETAALCVFNREPPARVPYGKTVTPDCFSYPPALFLQGDFAVCGPRRWALPLDPASLWKGSTETLMFAVFFLYRTSPVSVSEMSFDFIQFQSILSSRARFFPRMPALASSGIARFSIRSIAFLV